MSERRVTRRYVQGLLQVAQERDCVNEIDAGCRLLQGLVCDYAEVRQILYHPTIPRERKKQLLAKLCAGQAPDLFVRFVGYAIDKKRERIFETLHDEFQLVADEVRGIARAQVTAAQDLSETQIDRIKAGLEQGLGKTVELAAAADAALLGGLRVYVGSYVIDGSLSGRINRLHRYLLDEVRQLKTVA